MVVAIVKLSISLIRRPLYEDKGKDSNLKPKIFGAFLYLIKLYG